MEADNEAVFDDGKECDNFTCNFNGGPGIGCQSDKCENHEPDEDEYHGE